MDPRTAYQVVHMLEGVVQRGTATVLSDLGVPLFGKTGTTSGPTNVWFCGGNQDYVGGVYLGYDQPRSLGGYAQGGTFAAPIFKQMVQATKARWTRVPMPAPRDIHFVTIDRASGKQVFGATPGGEARAQVIWEAFKAETVPERQTREDLLASQRDALISALKRAKESANADKAASGGQAQGGNFAEQQGGVY